MKLTNALKHLANGSIWPIIGDVLYKNMPHKLKNQNLRFEQEEWRTYRRTEKRYRRFIDKYRSTNLGEIKKPDVVWILWLQGYNAAPPLVKACINSVKINNPDKQVVVLDKDNLSKYCALPDYITEKYKKGIIQNAQYSDLIRASLLAERGGTWCDATLFCDKGFPDYIESSPLFLFKEVDLLRMDVTPTVGSSWFISAVPNEPILCLTRDILFDYWRKKNHLDNYFLFHIALALSSRHFKDLWDAIPTFNNRSPHVLQFELAEPYFEKRWGQIMSMSPVHKLNHHIDYTKNGSGTNYSHVLDLYYCHDKSAVES